MTLFPQQDRHMHIIAYYSLIQDQDFNTIHSMFLPKRKIYKNLNLASIKFLVKWGFDKQDLVSNNCSQLEQLQVRVEILQKL